MTLHSNVVFLGTRETGFTQYALGHNVESDYFTLYLFAFPENTSECDVRRADGTRLSAA